MQVYMKEEKQSRQSIQPKLSEDQEESSQKQYFSIPEHLRNTSYTNKNSGKLKDIFLKNKKITETQKFRNNFDVQVISLNCESMRVLLQYGFFKMEISVIYTEIDQKIFLDDNISKGTFGIIKFGQFEGLSFAAKGVKYKCNEDGVDLESFYKEFFLCSIADFLQAGPKLVPLFGYDIFLTKTMAFFAMEECESIKPDSLEVVESQLLENLRVMHSVNFVHIDIKPGNVAFSKSLRKHVFIDFGLSKIIKEPPGQKTKTRFSGTLSYSSPQMNRCYFLSMPQFVDLYQNDLWCFKKTIQKLKSLLSLSIFSQDNTCIQKLANRNQLEPFILVVSIIRLKYYIQTENIEGVLRIFKRTANINRIVYEILTSPSVSKVIRDHSEIQESLKLIKKHILIEILADRSNDKLYEFFCDEKKSISADKIIPITQILQSKPELFHRFLTQPELIPKLFHFIQPFTKSNFQNKCQLKKALILKIYQMKQQQITGSVFFSEKVRFVVDYFYKALKNSKNLNVLIYLRLLFIAIQDWRYFSELQYEILSVIDDPFLKMLKTLEFHLFNNILLQNYESERKKKILDIIENTPIKKSEERIFKIKTLISLLMEKSSLAQYPLEFKFAAFNLIKEISIEFCNSRDSKQSVYLIKYTFIELCRTHYTAFLQEAPEGLALEIYSRFFSSLKVQLCGLELAQSKLFSSFERQVRSQVTLNSSQKQIIASIQNFLQISIQQNEFIGAVEKIRIFSDFAKKKYVFLYVEKIQQIFSDNSLDQVYQISKRFYYLNSCIRFIHRNELQTTGQERIQQQQKTKLFNDLQASFNKFIEGENIKKAIKLSRQFQIQVMIIRVKFGFQQGKTAEKIETQIRAIINLFKPQPFKFYPLLMSFLTIFGQLQSQIFGPRNHYSKEFLLQIGQEYVIKKYFYLFQKIKPILGYFIKIKNDQGKEEENLSMLLSLTEELRNESKVLNKRIMPSALLQKVKIFCFTSNVQKLIKIYAKIKMNKMEFQCGFYAYLVFKVFFFVKAKINQSEKQTQVIRTTLCLGRMAPICQIDTKNELFQLYKPLSKRNVLICERILISRADASQLKVIIKKLAHQISKIRRKKPEQVTQKLLSKISALKFVI